MFPQPVLSGRWVAILTLLVVGLSPRPRAALDAQEQPAAATQPPATQPPAAQPSDQRLKAIEKAIQQAEKGTFYFD